jgi:hypothetical protein
MTLLTLLTMSKLCIYAWVPLQPLDETMSTMSTMSECQGHRYHPSLNVKALTWLALQIGNEPSTTDDYLLSNGESERRRWAGQRMAGRSSPSPPTVR